MRLPPFHTADNAIAIAGVRMQPGAAFAIAVPAFGRPLRNTPATDPRAYHVANAGALQQDRAP